MRLPLLRVQPRRLQEVRAGRGHLHPGSPPGDGAGRSALRHLGRVRLVQHEPRLRAPRGVPRSRQQAPRPLPLRGLRHRPGPDHGVGHELENLGGRFQRGLPRAGHPSAAAGVARRHPRADRSLRAPQPLPGPVRARQPALPEPEGDHPAAPGVHDRRRHRSRDVPGWHGRCPPRHAGRHQEVGRCPGPGCLRVERRSALRRLPLLHLPQPHLQHERPQLPVLPPASPRDGPEQDVLRHADLRAHPAGG